jgi:hypothetical protein
VTAAATAIPAAVVRRHMHATDSVRGFDAVNARVVQAAVAAAAASSEITYGHGGSEPPPHQHDVVGA